MIGRACADESEGKLMRSFRTVPAILLTGGLLLVGCGGDAAEEGTDVAATAGADAGADAPADEVVGDIDREAEGGERPEDLPDDVPVPAGLTNVLSMGGDGRTQSFTGLVVGSTPTEVRDDLADQLEAAGWQVDRNDDTSGTSEDVAAAALEAEDGDRRYEATCVKLSETVNCQMTYTGA